MPTCAVRTFPHSAWPRQYRSSHVQSQHVHMIGMQDSAPIALSRGVQHDQPIMVYLLESLSQSHQQASSCKQELHDRALHCLNGPL